jgi:hypothetical protein
LILVDYPQQQRLKIWAEASIAETSGNPLLREQLQIAGYADRIERLVVLSKCRRSTGTARVKSRPAIPRRRSTRWRMEGGVMTIEVHITSTGNAFPVIPLNDEQTLA